MIVDIGISGDSISLISAIAVVGGVVLAAFKLGPERGALSSESLKAGTEVLSRALEEQRKSLQVAEQDRRHLQAQLTEQAAKIAALQAKTDITPIVASLEKQSSALAEIGKGLSVLLDRHDGLNGH